MRYQICVSGAARGKSVTAGKDLAFELGGCIARAGHILLTGATVGLPYEAARGAKTAGGQSIGLSPAATRYEHIRKYRLPTDMFDVVLFTGLNYVGRDTLLVNCSEAVVSIGGRMGTTHEFTVAIETGKPVGILEGAGGTSTLFDELLELAGHNEEQLIRDADPQVVLERIVDVLDSRYKKIAKSEPNIFAGKPKKNAVTEDKELEEYK